LALFFLFRRAGTGLIDCSCTFSINSHASFRASSIVTESFDPANRQWIDRRPDARTVTCAASTRIRQHVPERFTANVTLFKAIFGWTRLRANAPAVEADGTVSMALPLAFFWPLGKRFLGLAAYFEEAFSGATVARWSATLAFVVVVAFSFVMAVLRAIRRMTIDPSGRPEKQGKSGRLTDKSRRSAEPVLTPAGAARSWAVKDERKQIRKDVIGKVPRVGLYARVSTNDSVIVWRLDRWDGRS
jgi:hypothetical protein